MSPTSLTVARVQQQRPTAVETPVEQGIRTSSLLTSAQVVLGNSLVVRVPLLVQVPLRHMSVQGSYSSYIAVNSVTTSRSTV